MTPFARPVLFAVTLFVVACEATYPEVEDATTADAAASDTDAKADSATDAATVNDVAVTDSADATAVDAQADATPVQDAAADVTADVADAQADVPDSQADAVSDAIADVPDVSDVADVADTSDAGDATAELPFSATNIDLVGVDWGCSEFNYQPGACVVGTELSPPLLPGIHVDLPTAITYADAPPSSGSHRPIWGQWGSYIFLPQQRWLHNLEHGGVAFLYNPCAPATLINALQTIAKTWPADDSGPFRWVFTPYPGLPSAIALVTWGHVYEANCVTSSEISAFIQANYRKAPEDEPFTGSYDELWLADWP